MQSGTTGAYIYPFAKQIRVSADRTLTTQDLNGVIIVDASLGPVTITLPPAAIIRAGGYFMILALGNVTVQVQAGDVYNTGLSDPIVLTGPAQLLEIYGTNIPNLWNIPMSLGTALQRALGVQTFTLAHPMEDSGANQRQFGNDEIRAMGVVPTSTIQINTIAWYLVSNFIEVGQSQDLTVGVYSRTRGLLATAPTRTLSNLSPPTPPAADPGAGMQFETLSTPLTLVGGELYFLFAHTTTLTGGAFGAFPYMEVSFNSNLTQQRWLDINQVAPPAQVPVDANLVFSDESIWMQGVWK